MINDPRLDYNQLNLDAHYNIRKNSSISSREQTPLLTEQQPKRINIELEDAKSRAGFATRYFRGCNSTGVRLTEGVGYKPMLFADPRQERRDACCGLFRRKLSILIIIKHLGHLGSILRHWIQVHRCRLHINLLSS